MSSNAPDKLNEEHKRVSSYEDDTKLVMMPLASLNLILSHLEQLSSILRDPRIHAVTDYHKK